MTFSTKITFVPRDSDQKSLSFNHVDIGLIPPGKGMLDMKENILENFKSFYFREIGSQGGYDYVSTLTFEEFEEFYKSNFGILSNNNPQLTQFLITSTGRIRYNWVVIEINERESEMD
jgi:hypothetical protein